MKGRGGCVRSFGHEHDFCQAEKDENTDPRANYAVKYATARGHRNFGQNDPIPSWILAFWEGRKVPTKSLFEQEAPEIGTQKCSTK